MLDGLLELMPGDFVPGHLLGMGAMVFVAALLQGIGGLGFAMVSAPLAVPCCSFPRWRRGRCWCSAPDSP